MAKVIEKRSRAKKIGSPTNIQIRDIVRRELHGSEQRMDKMIRQAVGEAVAKREQMALLVLKGKSSMVQEEGIESKDVRNVAGMIGKLYERLSGTSSDIGEDYTFRNGRDARLLLDVQQELSKPKPVITRQEAQAVSLIYKRFFKE